jgi:hypothetical protein
MGFRSDVIDRIDDIIRTLSENLISGFEIIELGVNVDFRLWIDFPQTIRNDFGFLASDQALKRMKLAIEIGHANLVKVHDRDLTHSRARDALGSPRANAPKTDNHDMRVHELLHAVITDEAPHAIKAPVELVLIHFRFGHFLHVFWQSWGRSRNFAHKVSLFKEPSI